MNDKEKLFYNVVETTAGFCRYTLKYKYDAFYLVQKM